MKQSIAIIDLDVGNVTSVCGAFLNFQNEFDIIRTNKIDDISSCDAIVFPGVGAFGHFMENLDKSGLRDFIILNIVQQKKPFFGICVGMQVLAEFGLEMKKTEGLGLIKGSVEHLNLAFHPVPHVGWNDLSFLKDDLGLFDGVRDADFYFTHSYHLVGFGDDILAVAKYEKDIACAVLRDNIFATQFHPEKSGAAGLKLIENWLKMIKNQKFLKK